MTADEIEPSLADLSAIEAEWPQIQADLDALDVELRALGVHADPAYWRRYRRTEARTIRATVVALASRSTNPAYRDAA